MHHEFRSRIADGERLKHHLYAITNEKLVYSCQDAIFSPIEGTRDLNLEFARIRSFSILPGSEDPYIFTHKRRLGDDPYLMQTIAQEGFFSLDKALAHVEGGFTPRLSFYRYGDIFVVNDCKVMVDHITRFGSTVLVEGEDKDLETILTQKNGSLYLCDYRVGRPMKRTIPSLLILEEPYCSEERRRH